MKCVKCGVELPNFAKFCDQCKSVQKLICSKCGTENRSIAKLCINCGSEELKPSDGNAGKIKDVYGL